MVEKRGAIRKLWEEDPGVNPLFRAIFIVLSRIYAAALHLRAVLYRQGYFKSRRLPCKVVSVGNITAGGTGKTPMVMYLARHFTAMGLHTVIVSRGYKGGLEKGGGIVSDGCRIRVDAGLAGDEPFLLAQSLPGVPVVVGANRYRAGQLALREFSPDLILLDDAFQHLKLERDLDLVLLDGTRPFGNGYTLPAGELRESLSALDRADALAFTRTDPDSGAGSFAAADMLPADRRPGPVFRTGHVPVIRKAIPAGIGAVDLKGKRVYVFSGVAKNDYFLYTLAGLQCRVAGHRAFADHHRYLPADLQAICGRAETLGVDAIVTTEKDFVKLDGTVRWPMPLVVMGVEISFGCTQERFHSFLRKKLAL